MGEHALLSASSSHRWLNCPPSVRLCDGIADRGSEYAREGTDAHSLCEYKLKRLLGMDAADPTEGLDYFNGEMEECAENYASYILELMEKASRASPSRAISGVSAGTASFAAIPPIPTPSKFCSVIQR